MKNVIAVLLGIAILFMLGASFIVSATNDAAEIKDLQTAIEYNGSFYQVYDNVELTWSEADEFCRSLGGHLVTITSEKEQKFVESLLKNHNKNFYWLGGYKDKSKWEWTTGELFAYNNWQIGQPDNANGNEDRLMIYNKENLVYIENKPLKNDIFAWNDINHLGTYPNEDFWGAHNSGIICEWEYSFVTNNGVDDLKTATPYNGSYYKVYDNISLTWREAEVFCESLDGHLVTITSEDEQKFLEKLLKNHDRNFYWLGGYENKDKWFWVTGESFTYGNWEEHQPDNGNGNEDYLMIYNKVNSVYIGNELHKNSIFTWNDINNEGTYPNEDFWGVENAGIVCEWDYSCVSDNGVFKTHNWTQWVKIAESTCSAVGQKKRMCTQCNEESIVNTEIQPHTFGNWMIVTDATCHNSGSMSRKCSVCGYDEKKTTSILAHEWSEWTISVPATCYKSGAKERFCKLCRDIDQKDMDQLIHDYGEYIVVSGSKLIPPIIKERKCNLCGKIDQIEDWSYIWVSVVAAVATIGAVIGLISYIRAFKRD